MLAWFTACSAQAQDLPKPDAPAQQPADEKKEEEEKPPPPRKPFSIELGLGSWGLSGNERKFRQYATPPEGLFLKDLRWSPLPTLDRYSLVSLKGAGGSDYRGDARLSLMNGRTQLEGWFGRNVFFDPTAALIPQSDRDIHEGAVKQFVGRDFSLSARYRMDTEDHFFDIPREPNHQRTRYTDLIGAGRLGPGQVRLSLTDWRYFDRTEQLFDTNTSRVMLSYLWEASPSVGVEAAAGRATVDQPGAASFDVNQVSLVGDFAAGPATDVEIGLHRDSQGTPVTQNAYTRESRLASARVIHRWSRWTGQLALQARDIERVRGDQNFVDVPRWATLEGRISGRLNPEWRLTFRAYSQSLSKAPPMTTQDRRHLLIDGRQFMQLKLDGGKPELNGYLVWTNNTIENGARDVRVTASLLTLGANWETGPALSVFGELTRENWSGRTEIVEFPTYASFAPDSTAITLGANWVIDAATYVSANVTNYRTDNDNPLQERDGSTRGTFFTLNARRRLAGGNEIGLIIAPWFYRDRLRGTMDYDANVVMLTGSARF